MQHAKDSENVAPDALSSKGVRRVLIVDDNVDAADALGQILGMEGHEVAVAYDPHAALAEVAVRIPDVALIDIDLPGMDGYALANKLLQATAPYRPCLIAVTGLGTEADRAQAAAAGFSHQLLKPVELDRLLCLMA